ncbi:MAG TPA: hydrogen peroxide-dependent heme synthase [Bryobacteraceae bacterium]|nr:hydrogen peroxide-dependent heme synthase [Bryobacteraceae bacterium]
MSSAIELPPVPITLEGAGVLHQMMRFRWAAWRDLDPRERSRIVDEAVWVLKGMEERSSGSSALFSLLGHKGDLLFVHFRESLEELNQAELRLSRLALSEYLEPASSYLSVVELGLYESTSKTYAALAEKGVQPHTPEWNAAIAEVIARQKEAMHSRLYPEIPPHKYICFYPMDRRRGEVKNWYLVPMAERQRMMHEHGLIGRRYAGEVKQIISGSIGLDDWEWGVDLFADDPLVFKRLIYEMRFDEVSAVYALFGTFYVGVRCRVAELKRLLDA